MVWRLSALLCLIGLAACATGQQFTAEVTRFHGGGTNWIEEARVTFRPARPALAAEDFGRYAQIVGGELAKAGFLPAGDGPADILAELDVAVTPVFAGRGTDVSSYERRIALILTENGTGRRLWEGRAISIGPVRDIDYTLPFLARALMKDFPGLSGTSEEVEIPLTAEDDAGEYGEDIDGDASGNSVPSEGIVF